MTRTFAQSIDNEEKEKHNVLQVAKWFPRDNNKNRLTNKPTQQLVQTLFAETIRRPVLGCGVRYSAVFNNFNHGAKIRCGIKNP